MLTNHQPNVIMSRFGLKRKFAKMLKMSYHICGTSFLVSLATESLCTRIVLFDHFNDHVSYSYHLCLLFCSSVNNISCLSDWITIIGGIRVSIQHTCAAVLLWFCFYNH